MFLLIFIGLLGTATAFLFCSLDISLRINTKKTSLSFRLLFFTKTVFLSQKTLQKFLGAHLDYFVTSILKTSASTLKENLVFLAKVMMKSTALCHYRSSHLTLTWGLGDPMLTGQIFGITQSFIPFFYSLRPWFILKNQPDFNQKILRLSGTVQISVRLWRLVGLGVWALFYGTQMALKRSLFSKILFLGKSARDDGHPFRF